MIVTKCFKNSILLSGPNKTSERSSYLFSLDGGFFECEWIDACPPNVGSRPWMTQIGCKGVETIIYRHSYISQVVYDRNLYFGLGQISKPNSKLADFSWWLFEIIHIICLICTWTGRKTLQLFLG